ncbi:hypothetical protein [Pelolinea submarina]|uniref:Uncharacterized protein n=1 Tax=Pelolinea submarina TaxID=913107 RepID=A0A347ZPA3_9CHLR|nr:hypothetical protein [Pelolinea submarina]REG08735.1 hypothetical protein DFR64_2110 [Pelolinea submarina]BBB47134.1 hypothetical protein Pelsub_P0361 [Pelolinea submarina]
MTTSVNPTKLHQELLAAGLPVVSVASDGRVDYSRDLTTTEQITAAAVIAAHNTSQSTEEARIAAYFDSGISLQDLVFALWYKIMQGDATNADAIQASMDSINTTIH